MPEILTNPWGGIELMHGPADYTQCILANSGVLATAETDKAIGDRWNKRWRNGLSAIEAGSRSG